MSNQITKSRFWCALGYPENMLTDWQSVICDTLQIPAAYCIHDHDLQKDGDARKVHVHFLLAFSNTTTKKHAQEVIESLQKPGQKAFMPVQACINVRNSYDYLIHDTEESRKKGKYQYSKDSRICINNFDIGVYEQVSTEDDFIMFRELVLIIKSEKISSLLKLDDYILKNMDSKYLYCLKRNQFFLKGYCDSVYQSNRASDLDHQKEYDSNKKISELKRENDRLTKQGEDLLKYIRRIESENRG